MCCTGTQHLKSIEAARAALKDPGIVVLCCEMPPMLSKGGVSKCSLEFHSPHPDMKALPVGFHVSVRVLQLVGTRQDTKTAAGHGN